MNDAMLADRKVQLRSMVKVLRDAMPHAERAAFSEQAAAHLLKTIDIQPNQVVGLFWPIRSEIDVLALVDPLRKRGARLALPATLKGSRMVFREWFEGSPITDAGFGTFAPDDKAPIVEPQTLLMPLLAYDEMGNRLGYGAGFYDRYIAGLRDRGHEPELIGMAFSLQKLDKVPVGRYDLPLDMIVTEVGLIKPSDNSQ